MQFRFIMTASIIFFTDIASGNHGVSGKTQDDMGAFHFQGIWFTGRKWEPLFPREGEEPDACGVWTGAAVYGEKQYHIFYTGYNYNVHFQQTICHAVSDDGIHFEKDPKNPIIIPNEKEYEVVDWRDPYVFYNEG